MNFVLYLHPTNAKQISHIKNRRLKKFIFAIFTFFCINSIHFYDTFMSDWIQVSKNESFTFLCSVTTNEQKRGKKKSGQQKHARKSYFYHYTLNSFR